MLYNLLISDKKIEIGTQVRGLVNGMLEAIEVIYVTLIKKKNSRLFEDYITYSNERVGTLHCKYIEPKVLLNINQ
jgi:ABC-type xylose transport system substrate-binding protein